MLFLCSVARSSRTVGTSLGWGFAVTHVQRFQGSSVRKLHLFREQAFVAGQWTDAFSGDTFEVTNPSNGKTLGHCSDMSEIDTITAIETAQKAFESFRHTSAKERSQLLRKWFELMRDHEESLAKILMLENGRPIAGARQEIKYAASFLDWFAGEAVRSYGYSVEGSSPGIRAVTIKQPIGVVGVITPWNFPSAMITRKVAGAIAAGCSVVVKPAAETPYSALALAELAQEAGMPKGVFNVVTTHKNIQDVGRTICTHPAVKKISFTGSTNVGKMLMKMASGTLKKCSFELGGNSPFIVMNDADISKTIKGLLAGKFRGSGQTCVSPNRILVQSGVHDKFVEALTKEVEKSMQLGVLEDESTMMGCLITDAATNKIQRLLKDAQDKGAKIVTGGSLDTSFGNNYFPATVLTGLTHDMAASREEIFGPLAMVYRFETEDEVVNLANQTSVGLAAYIYTESLPTAWRIVEKLEVGMTGVNCGTISDPFSPFGGVKESGFGREGGRYGMEEFQVTKTITLGGLELPYTPL